MPLLSYCSKEFITAIAMQMACSFAIRKLACLRENDITRSHCIFTSNVSSYSCLTLWGCCVSLCSARFVCVKTLSNRPSIHGIVLLSLFVYKYVADTAFILISCRKLPYQDDNSTYVSQLSTLKSKI